MTRRVYNSNSRKHQAILDMTLSRDENVPPRLCLPTMDGEVMCGEEPPVQTFCTTNQGNLYQQDLVSPKSISLLDCEDLSGSVEVEITPDLAARFEEYDHHLLGFVDSSRPAGGGVGGDHNPHHHRSADFGDHHHHHHHRSPEYVTPRRRSLSQTAAFPSHIPFPSLDSPKNRRASMPIAPRASSSSAGTASSRSSRSTDRSEWIKESLQRMDVNAEKRRMNSAASVGIESILSGMRQHRDNDRVQRYGCGALQKLACQSDTNRALIAEAGGVLDILMAMERHKERASIQECGCLALSSLSRATNGNAMIAEYNGIETILRSMRAHGGQEAVQKHGCLVLLSLACSSADHNSAIARLGGIEDIMNALSSHRGNTGITEYGSAALWSLAYMNSDNGDAIRKAGGLDAIFDALNSTDKDELPSVSQEDQCMQVINKQRTGEIENQDPTRRESQGVDAILSVFVRPLQQ